ncbi:hypothetical protein [Mucilaginibacter sp. CSA2-8R]|uniref:hypothetical protein n=1 Tax=Mucilaginibacter sp. CSA2-8R TaxID=3141542 RepID=UPI00315D0C56
MAELIKCGTQHVVTYDLIKELQLTLDKTLYRQLNKGAFEKAPPYVQLYSFVLHTKVCQS